MTYVSRGTDRVDEEDVRRAVEEAFPITGGEIMPTLAEKWIEQGTQQALREALIEILEDRFETVSQTLKNKLKKINDPDLLKSLHKKALHAGSLEEFKDAVQVSLI